MCLTCYAITLSSQYNHQIHSDHLSLSFAGNIFLAHNSSNLKNMLYIFFRTIISTIITIFYIELVELIKPV